MVVRLLRPAANSSSTKSTDVLLVSDFVPYNVTGRCPFYFNPVHGSKDRARPLFIKHQSGEKFEN